ncbi:B12-binding domain-containing radical SAM protein [Shewanella sp. 3B26]|uniref:B12-binding domain-containing radical SAM protein n=1 Tax=Shewanella zhuhaiensis TaxID=2919576 RepID=A0AAJ1EXA9_9GAMM|nr:radical SAM protein [Shewanella zhuhaiensis]MCH4293794.1 B12-binding domain-containing radical SAM protein [Shewanella zhuhaiensis]
MFILVTTPVGRTELGEQIDYFPSRWSGSSGQYKVTTFFPFNLAYLTSMLKRDTGHQVRFVDMNYYGVDSDEYLSIVNQLKPDILIVEIDSIIYRKQMAIFRTLKLAHPTLKIIACGPQVSASPTDALANGVDFVATGEFEESITELINADFATDVEGIYPNGRRKLLDVNSLPFPEDEDVSRRNYCRLYGSEYNEVEMWVTRGCPVMCNFCVVANVYYGKPNHRTRSLDNVIAEIKYLQKSIPDLQGIFFNEEAHTINRNYLRDLCRRLIEEGLNKTLKFNCMGNYDTLDTETLKLMKEAGYYKVRIGLESLDESVMQHISKFRSKSNVSRLLDVLHDCRALGIKVYGTMSVGTVGANYDSDIESLNTIEKLHAEGYIQEFSLSINTPLQGTPFFDKAKEENWLIATSSDYDGSYGSMVELPEYPAALVNKAFEYGSQIRARINQKNQENGVHYSSYDRQWCAPVYATSSRKEGTGIL